jgi:hypothetical protein
VHSHKAQPQWQIQLLIELLHHNSKCSCTEAVMAMQVVGSICILARTLRKLLHAQLHALRQPKHKTQKIYHLTMTLLHNSCFSSTSCHYYHISGSSTAAAFRRCYTSCSASSSTSSNTSYRSKLVHAKQPHQLLLQTMLAGMRGTPATLLPWATNSSNSHTCSIPAHACCQLLQDP